MNNIHFNSFHMQKIFRLTFIAVISIIAFLTGCKKSPAPLLNGNDSLPLLVGLSADYPPFEYQNKGKIEGLDVDMINAIAKKMNRTVKIVDIDFSGLIPALKTGRIDCIISAINPTPQRLEQLSFSIPYCKPGNDSISVVSPKSAPLLDVIDFKNKTIGVQMGSSFEILLKLEQKDLSDMKIIALGRCPQLIQELKVGRLDGVVMDTSQAKAFVVANPTLTYHTVIFEQIPEYCIATRKSDRLLMVEINDAIADLKASGEIQKIQEKWFTDDDTSAYSSTLSSNQ
jgi:ABC-type amino acid transport substrate-binding protein